MLSAVVPSSLARPLVRALFAITLLFAAVACGNGEGADPAGPGAGAPPPAGVETVTLSPRPLERTTEYIATVRSRRSTTIQPQVEGFITAITAQPGQRVARGATLMRIDSGRQQAAVASLESMRAARDADLQFARQQAERMKTLFEAGAVSKQTWEQAATTVQTSEAQMRAADAQIREQQLELGFHRVSAPTGGIVGDIPVRVGDRVTRQTVLTTIDENAGLELYINVPVAQATGLKPGLTVRVVDDAGKPLETTAINFISPAVDTNTQSVLMKAPLGSGGALRTDQFVRCLVVWSNEPGLTVPLVAVNRINGQHFVYIAEKGDGGAMVARQRVVQVGTIIGNDYVVTSGVKEGEQLIVSGVQKIGDGAPVNVTPATPGAAPAPASAQGR